MSSERENCTQCGTEYEVVYHADLPKPDEQVTCDQCGATLQPRADSGKPEYRLIRPRQQGQA